MKMHFVLFFLFLSILRQLNAAEPEDLISELISHQKSPRLLSTEDAGFHSITPLPLTPIKTDVNNDKVMDHIISGIYNLPTDPNRFFLLVASERNPESKAERLYFDESSTPYYIHKPGMTGKADPKDQIFSISHCIDCEKGWDFYWDARTKSLFKKPWSERIEKITKVIEQKAFDVPEDKVDAALKIVGRLPDVQRFVKNKKDKKLDIKTRVERIPESPDMKQVSVKILYVQLGKEKLWDDIVVDLDESRIVRRKRKA